MAGEKNAYRVSDTLVNVNGILYPITHNFIVKEVEQEADWLDDFDGAILECYNCFGWGTEGITTVMGSHNIASSVSMSVTFAVNNLNYKFEPWSIGGSTYYDLYGDSVGWEFAGYTWTGPDDASDFDRYTEITGFIIGGMEPFQGVADRRSHFGGGNNQIVTLSASTPGSGRAYHVVERWNPSLPRTKDMVFWLYDFSFKSNVYHDSYYGDTMTMYLRVPPNGFPYERVSEYKFDAASSTFPKSDALFLPGQQGRRIISNDYKYAPWERYPHLM